MMKQIFCWCLLVAMMQASSLSCADPKKEVPFTRQLIGQLQKDIYSHEDSKKRLSDILRHSAKEVSNMLYDLLFPALKPTQDNPWTEIQRTFAFNEMIPTALCFSSDNTYALAGYKDGLLRIWQCPTFVIASTHFFDDCPYEVTAVSFSPDGTYLLAGYKNGTIKMISCDEETTFTFRQKERVSTVCCSLNNKIILTAEKNETLYLWHQGIDKPSQIFKPRGRGELVEERAGIFTVALSPTASLIFGIFDEKERFHSQKSSQKMNATIEPPSQASSRQVSVTDWVIRGWWQQTEECCLIWANNRREIANDWGYLISDDIKHTEGKSFVLPLWNSRRGKLQGILEIGPTERDLIVNTDRTCMAFFARKYNLVAPSVERFSRGRFEREMQAFLSRSNYHISVVLFLTLLALTKHPLVEWFGHLGRPYSPSFLDMACQASAQFLTEDDFSSKKENETVQNILKLASWLKFVWDDIDWPENIKNHLVNVFHVPSEIEDDFPILNTVKRYAARYNTSVEVSIPEVTGEYVYF